MNKTVRSSAWVYTCPVCKKKSRGISNCRWCGIKWSIEQINQRKILRNSVPQNTRSGGVLISWCIWDFQKISSPNVKDKDSFFNSFVSK